MIQSYKETTTSLSVQSYVDRIKRLADSNRNLKEQFDKLTTKLSTIQEQNKNYQEILHTFLPESEIEKTYEERKTVRRLRMISVLYIGYAGFDELYKSDDASKMIDCLDELTLEIEKIAQRNNMLAIKTLGDTTLYAIGLHGENRTNAIDIVKAAFEMQCFINLMKEQNPSFVWSLKMAIHTGPMLAIPESENSSAYRFSGENLTTSVRLGKTANPNEIVVSVMTYELIKEFFEGALIGEMPAKYIGSLDVYKVNNWIQKFKDKESLHQPNYAFKVKYGHIKFMDLEEEMLDYLERKLPKELLYHNVKHTIDVVTEVELIGWAEGVTEEELLLLKLAALFHDAGHIVSYENHEYHSTLIARERMSSYDFPLNYINQVCNLIMATQMPPNPTTLLEKIMCDSDLDYLGRADFIPISDSLFAELKEYNMVESYNEWNKRQVEFIKGHQYYTKTALKLREVNKQKQIERLEQLIK